MATVTAANVENPNGDLVPNDMFPISKDALKMQPPAFSLGGGEESKGKPVPPAEAAVVAENDADVADAQKKMERADEIIEKGNTQAERFHSSKHKQSEDLKKTDTAERFGTKQYDTSGEGSSCLRPGKKPGLLQEVSISCMTFAMAKMIMELFGKGRYLPTELVLYALAMLLVLDVSRYYGRKLAEKIKPDK